jgi:hypothetical protein
MDEMAPSAGVNTPPTASMTSYQYDALTPVPGTRRKSSGSVTLAPRRSPSCVITARMQMHHAQTLRADGLGASLIVKQDPMTHLEMDEEALLNAAAVVAHQDQRGRH